MVNSCINTGLSVMLAAGLEEAERGAESWGSEEAL